CFISFFFFQAEDGIRDATVTGVQTCALPISVYSFASQYTDTGLVGVYLGTREENLAPCLEIARDQLGEIAAGRIKREELARAKESLKGRIMLSMESTSNRMTRLGKSLITDTELLSFERIIAELDAV